MAAASAAGRALISGLEAAGNTIFWAASWLCTSVATTECPHSSSPPPTARTTASTRPAIVAIASNVFLRISGASLRCRAHQHGVNPLLNNQQPHPSPARTAGPHIPGPQDVGPRCQGTVIHIGASGRRLVAAYDRGVTRIFGE